MTRLTRSLLFLAAGLIPLAAFAQQRGRGQFRLPQVGTRMPDVQIFDAEGEPFSTRDLKGDYSVLVFGCLT